MNNKNKIMSRFELLRTLLAVGIAVVFAVVIIFLVSSQPLEAIYKFFVAPLTSFRYIANIIELMTPLLFTGLAVTFILQTKVYNLAVEGRLCAGGVAAARAAMCDEFVSRMPQGYDTMIGENGGRLSGGERQRISIARAILKDAPVVLLDEATASLDVENETQVQQALSRLLAGKTVLVIAHRMRTVANADKIVVLKEGRVAEQGAPAELMAREGGLYRRMVELQTEASGWSLAS